MDDFKCYEWIYITRSASFYVRSGFFVYTFTLWQRATLRLSIQANTCLIDFFFSLHILFYAGVFFILHYISLRFISTKHSMRHALVAAFDIKHAYVEFVFYVN